MPSLKQVSEICKRCPIKKHKLEIITSVAKYKKSMKHKRNW